VSLSEIDRSLLNRCLARKPDAWDEFVDRFIGLVSHVINHSAQARSLRLGPADRDDLAAEVFLTIVKDDFAVLRHFRGESTLATYLTVVVRRVVVRELLNRKKAQRLTDSADSRTPPGDDQTSDDLVNRLGNREEVERLLQELDTAEAQAVRMFHLEGKSYREISSDTGMPANTIGPTLSRARHKMRRSGTGSSAD